MNPISRHDHLLSASILLVCVALLAIACSFPAHAQTPSALQKETVVSKHAAGTFEVKVTPQTSDDSSQDATLGRMSIDKQFHGDLQGTSKGQMLTAGTAVPIVPCHLMNTFEAFPPGARFPRPLKVRLKIGPPLLFDAVPNAREGWQQVVSEAEAAVRRLADPVDAP